MTVTVSLASRYSNVMFLRFKNAAERRKAEDKQYEAAFFTPDRFYLATTASGEPHDLPKSLHGKMLSNDYWGEPAVFGRTEIPTYDLYGLLLRRNMLLYDKHSRRPFLQRLNPRTHELDNAVTKAIEKGRQRFEAVRKRCRAHYKRSIDHATSGQDRKDPFHFGVWYEPGSQCPVPTLDTLQGDDSEATESVLRFMVWLRSYVDTYVQSFVDESNLEDANRVKDDESGPAYITPKFKESINRRPADFEWLAGKVALTRDLCHPLYNACTAFCDDRSEPARSPDHSGPTLLLSLGFACLVLGTYQNAEIDLRPGECLLIDPKTTYHFKPHPGRYGPETDVWMVSCFFQKQVHERLHPEETADSEMQMD